MRRFFGIALVLTIGAGSVALAGEREHPWSFQGTDLLPTSESGYGSRSACEHVEGLKSNFGINSVVTRQYFILPSYENPNIEQNDFVQEDQIQRQLHVNQALGLKTVLSIGIRLRSDVGSENKHSQDTIEFATAEEYDSFFYEYRNRLSKYARIARRDGNVSIFSIGNNLATLANTKPLQDGGAEQTYLSQLTWDRVNKLIRFNTSVAQRRPADASASGGSGFRRFIDGLLNKVLNYDHHRDLAELRRWSESNGRSTLSDSAKSFVIELENRRRSYLKGMWVQTIQTVRDEFADMPSHRQPVLTYNADYQLADQVDFWRDLDQISVSTYLSVDKATDKAVGKDQDRSVRAFEGKWADSMKSFDQFVRSMDPPKKVLFSELLADRGPADPQAHANMIQALNHVVAQGGVPWLDGILFWDSYAGNSRSISGFKVQTCQKIFMKRAVYSAPAVTPAPQAVQKNATQPSQNSNNPDSNGSKPTTMEQLEKLRDLLF